MPRRSGEDTRRLLIATGIAMLHERGATVGVSHIRLQEVVKRAGLTTGAAYRLWDNQEDFHRELAVAAVRRREEDPVGRTTRAIADLVEAGASMSEVVRVAAAAHIDGLDEEDEGHPSASDTFLTTLALRAGARHGDELQEASRDRHAGSIESFVDLYTVLMKTYGMRMRPPFTVRHFAVAVAALGEGFALHAIEGEDHPVVCMPDAGDRTGTPPEWTLFGVAVSALVEAMMAPDRPGEPAAAWQPVSRGDK
jgi:AcrR family transcriptional regulator